jgi:SsrA-binding protein
MAINKKKPNKNLVNRKARFNYELGEAVVAGIVLSGPEVAGIRRKQVNISNAYANINQAKNQLEIINMVISIPNFAVEAAGAKELTQNRVLLVTAKQLAKLKSAKKDGLSIIPTKIFTETRLIKIELKIGKGKKLHDKRQTIKKREFERKLN